MTSKLTIAKVGGGEIELTGFTGLKGAPMLDQNDHLVELGQRFANGEASQGQFKLIDPVGELPRTDFEYNLPAHKLVTWTEDASGDEIWLSRGRVSTYDGGRGFPTGGDQVEYDAIVDDGNVELRGQAFTEPWVRPEETGHARLVALQAYTLNGATSTNPTARATCEVTVSDSHLAPNADTATMPAKTYPSGTQPQEVVTECADTEGKVYGVVIHHDGGSHLCLLYIVEGDHTVYVSSIKISDQIADWDPTDLAAPVFEPHWEMGKATVYDGQQLVSGLVSTWGTDQSVFSEHSPNIDEYDRWIEHFSDSESETALQASQVNESERTYRQLTHVTHRVSIIMLPEQLHLVTAGMSLQIKATAAIAGQYLGTYQTRRVAEHSFRPRSDGRYWADLNLDRVIRRRAYRAGGGSVSVPSLCRDETSACLDPMDRLSDGDWGASPILCLDWRASSQGLHTDDGSVAYQTPTGAGEVPTDWLDLDAWDGSTLDFKLKVKGNGTDKSIHIYPWDQGVIQPYGPADDPFLSLGFRWSWGFSGGDLYTAVTSENNGIVSTGGGTTLAIAGAEDDWVWLRCQLNDLSIKMKAWLDGTSEPGTWTNTGTSSVSLLDADGLLRADVFALRHILDATGEQWIDSLEFTSGVDCDGVTCTRCITGGPGATSGTSPDAAPADHDHDSVDTGDTAGGELSGSYPDPTVNAIHAGSNHLQPVRKNSTGTVFERRRLNLIEGTNVTLTVADDSGNDEVDITIAASGGGGSSPIIDNGTGDGKMDAGVQRIYDEDELAYLTLSGYTELFSTDEEHMYLGVNAGNDGGGAKIYLQGGVGVVFPNYSADPAGGDSENGQVYYNTSTHKLKVYANGTWVALH